MKVVYKNKTYEINKAKVEYVLSQLMDKPIKNLSDKEVIALMEDYLLFDEIFLTRINDLKCKI